MDDAGVRALLNVAPTASFFDERLSFENAAFSQPFFETSAMMRSMQDDGNDNTFFVLTAIDPLIWSAGGATLFHAASTFSGVTEHFFCMCCKEYTQFTTFGALRMLPRWLTFIA